MKRWIPNKWGEPIDPFNLTTDDIHIDDIAQSLSRETRFLGRTPEPYYVAQHCILVATHLFNTTGSNRLALLGLLHDAEEAYTRDWPSPIKGEFPTLRPWADKVHSIILAAFEIDPPSAEEAKQIHAADMTLLATEFRDFFPDAVPFTEGLDQYTPLKDHIIVADWRMAESAYKRYFAQYYRAASLDKMRAQTRGGE